MNPGRRLAKAEGMYAVLAVAVDLIHALAMVLWIVGLPLLFVRRYPRLRLGYAVYAIAFIVLNRLSMAVLDECFLTALVRPLWARAGAVGADEWFTVRAAYVVFGMAPSHRAVALAGEALIFLTAAGVLLTAHRATKRGPALASA
ncbi:MAG: hypothetical protein KIT84_40120 [Labilithrix sp.]|nr:hypothetical protein [Labilithrix sp.]MCW5817273.1 hypothetical protein [Labilithrix sp.]